MTQQDLRNQCATHTLGSLAFNFPKTREVFARHNIDICCQEDMLVLDAARQAQVDPRQLCNELNAAASAEQDEPPLDELETDEILARLTNERDQAHIRQLFQLQRLARKIEAVHRGNAQVPHGLTRLLKLFNREFIDHLEREQQHVFAHMAGDQPPRPETPISQMNQEHDELGKRLKQIRALTNQYQTPPDACRSWQRLYLELEALDDSITEQVQLERNVLYPRFQF